jgi:aryl-alcohol dehydrogenase-like predicted oxidoreductase
MKYNYLGKSGVRVSELCLGTMMFGGATDKAESARIIDTADIYNAGESERIVGQAIARNRHDWVLATKVGNPMGAGPNERGMSRKWIMKAADDCLRRLGTEHIDLLYIHKADFNAPLAEMVYAFQDLIRMGKITYLGVSNLKAWRLTQTAALAAQAGMQGPVATQPLYNLLNREAEVEHLPAAEAHGVGIVAYSPLARGILTGKYQPGLVPLAESRAGRADVRMMEAEWRPESLLVAEKLAQYAKVKGVAPAHFALRWVMRNQIVTSTLVGPRTFEQWSDYLTALNYELDDDDEKLVDQLVSPGKSSTLAPFDPHHPVEGRKMIRSQFCG